MILPKHAFASEGQYDLSPRKRKPAGQMEIPGLEEEQERITAVDRAVNADDPRAKELKQALVQGTLKTAVLHTLPRISSATMEEMPDSGGVYNRDAQTIRIREDLTYTDHLGHVLTHEVAHHHDRTISPQFHPVMRDPGLRWVFPEVDKAETEGFATGVEARHRDEQNPPEKANSYDTNPYKHFRSAVPYYRDARKEGLQGSRPGVPLPDPSPGNPPTATRRERGRSGQLDMFHDWDPQTEMYHPNDAAFQAFTP
jgi:hypothetical protein